MNALLLSFMMLWTSAETKPPVGAEGIILPNSTINPWTGKWTCHKWPKQPTTPVIK